MWRCYFELMQAPLSHAQLSTHPLVFKRWLFLADKLERQPDLLAIPLKNIKNWISNERLADIRPLIEWQEMIECARTCDAGMSKLLEFLRKDGEETRVMKSCSPFAGVLTRDERDQFTCAWTH
jgi:hypothetical protein